MNETGDLIFRWREHFETQLEHSLNSVSGAPELLHQAMAYSTLAGGKRIRPMLVYAACEALKLDYRQMDPVACAIEMIHTYSLIHDDLPAMDNDDLRRGRPTCHKAFDDATAILAGDALQALAFELLASSPALSERSGPQAEIIRAIANACGCSGMAGGQILDLAAVGKRLSLTELSSMHRLKTGALIRISAMAPALFSSAEPELTSKLQRYGDAVGLAFQIHDDILDVTGTEESTGKSTQTDAELEKPTFPDVLGLEASRREAGQLRDTALAELHGFPGDCSALSWLASYAIDRDN